MASTASARLRLAVLVLTLGGAGCTAAAPWRQTTATTTPVHAVDVNLVRRGDGSWYVDAPERLPLARVVRVIDGDTLIVESADGGTQRVRAFGLDAPEIGEGCGAEATLDLERSAGQQVRLLEDRREHDQFGRELRYVFTPSGQSIDAELIGHGSARAWREDGAFRDILVGVESSARSEGRGCLWQPS